MDNRTERKARGAIYAALTVAEESGASVKYTAEAIAAAELLGQDRLPGFEIMPQAERLILKARQKQDTLF